MSQNSPIERTIQVNALARVEGEGALTLRLKDGKAEEVSLRIYEPPRFFEALLRGREAKEAPDITARICGICPVAYQMTSVHALEKIFGVTMPPSLRALRRLLYCGEWIESHALHVFFLHAPDFLGFESAVAMAQASPELAARVRQGLRLKKAGNSIVKLVGGREVHPINVKVGGFYRTPNCSDLRDLLPELKWAREASADVVRWTASLSFPDFAGDYEFVALRHADEYPMNEGRIVSSRGLDCTAEEFTTHFEERQVQHSNAKQAVRKATGTAYFVGPMARWNLNADRLPAEVLELAQEVQVLPPVRNPYRGIVIRAMEIHFAFTEAIRLIETCVPLDSPAEAYEPKAGLGSAATEAPRGLLWNHFETDDTGLLRTVVIVPPTSQNQRQIELDLLRAAPELAAAPEPEATLQAERIIRNYDPCISCATHFLKLKVEGR